MELAKSWLWQYGESIKEQIEQLYAENEDMDLLTPQAEICADILNQAEQDAWQSIGTTGDDAGRVAEQIEVWREDETLSTKIREAIHDANPYPTVVVNSF